MVKGLEITAENLYFNLDLKRVQAANRGNALDYYSLCVQGGFKPEEQFEELYNQGYQEFKQLDQEFVDAEFREKEQKYSVLAEEVKKNHLNPENIFGNPQIKATLLKKVLGYNKLRGDNNSILYSEPSKIGNAFKSACNKSRKLGFL